METQVRESLRSCPTCQKIKHRRTFPFDNPNPFGVAQRPFEEISIDEISGLEKSRDGNDATWVIVDRFTRTVITVPVKKKGFTSEDLAHIVMSSVIQFYGVPRRIISDRDPRMVSKSWSHLQKMMGTR